MLEIVAANGNLSVDGMLQIGADWGYQIGTVVRSARSLNDNIIRTTRDLGLVDSDELELTDLGRAVVQLFRRKPGTFGEILHFLFYTRWTDLRPREACFSWSYRTVSDALWEAGSTTVDAARLVSRVSELAMDRFQTANVSFSKDSVRGIVQWLGCLRPSVLDPAGKRFARRTFCPPETFVLAVDQLYREERADYQTNLLLDRSKQERICRLCHLEPTSFEDVLEWAAGQYPFLQRGAGGGWGAYVVLCRQPRLEELAD